MTDDRKKQAIQSDPDDQSNDAPTNTDMQSPQTGAKGGFQTGEVVAEDADIGIDEIDMDDESDFMSDAPIDMDDDFEDFEDVDRIDE